MGEANAIRDAAAMVHAFMREHESSDAIAGYAACPECFTVFAGFRIHANNCSIGRAADSTKLLCEMLGGDVVAGARMLVAETAAQPPVGCGAGPGAGEGEG